MSNVLQLVSLTAVLMTTGLNPGAFESQSADVDDVVLSLTSTYLSSPINYGDRPYHQITFTGRIHGESGVGVLSLDPNQCQLNLFGDRSGCTEIALTEIQVQLVRVPKPDPQNRQLFRVSADGLPESCYIVVPSDAGVAYRFIIADHESASEVVALDAFERSGQ